MRLGKDAEDGKAENEADKANAKGNDEMFLDRHGGDGWCE